MLIEQIIKFQLRGPVPPGRTCNAKTDYFHKTKISKTKFRVKYYLTAKNIAGGNVPCCPALGPSQLQNLTQNAKVYP